MADNISVVTELSNNQWTITAEVVAGSTVLPAEIFVYENLGTTTLGPYVGVCDRAELLRFQIWTGTAIPKFGNRFVRTSQAKINVSLSSDPQPVITNLISSAKALKTELLAETSSTTVHTI
jgi:hypothetical protein